MKMDSGDEDLSPGGPTSTINEDMVSPSTLGQQAHPVRKYKKHKDQKYCLICSDKALGYNFNAISCESCKAFFRRNALKNQNLRCLFTGSCNIDVRTRRFCPYCRLKKCYEIGMRKEMILDDSEKKVRMQKVTMNRIKKKMMPEGYTMVPGMDQSQYTDNMMTPVTSVQSMYIDHHTEVSENSLQGYKDMPPLDLVQPNHMSIKREIHDFSDESNPSVTDKYMPSEAPCTTTVTSSDSSTMCHSLSHSTKGPPIPMLDAQGFEKSFKVDKRQLPKEECYYRKLTEDEIEIIENTTKSYRDIMTSYVLEDHVNQEDQYTNLDDLVNNSEFAVRRLIKFVKLLPDFKKLPQEYQIQSLKSCVLRTLLLRSVNFYDMEQDAWKTPTGCIPNHVLKNATGYHELHDGHTIYCRTLKNLSDDDLNIMSLLQMVIIFDPDIQNVPDYQVMSDVQDRYILLLKHYLESTVSFAFGQLLLSKLLNKIDELKVLGDSHAKILLQVNANQIEPLMLEVLNLPVCDLQS